jgi:radical SAM protein with 4Fe4S-binding SPASM domain
MNKLSETKSGGLSQKQRKESDIPVIHSHMVLRKEYFGGYIFNPYFPPEIRLDHVRFKIATLCDGIHTLGEIKKVLLSNLSHSREYIDLLVNNTISSFSKSVAIYWRQEKLESPQDFGLTVDNTSNIRGDRQLSAPIFVIWEVTGRCNLRCKHCLSDSGTPYQDELTTQEAKNLIDAFEAIKVFNISFSGGEPLIRPDIFELLEYSSRKKIGIELLTNGTLITKEVIDRFENINLFNVQISIDGIGTTHDEFRGIDGAYKRAVKATQLLRDADYEVVISSAVTKQNIGQINELIDIAIDLGASAYKTTLFMPAGRGKGNLDRLVLTPEDAKEFAFMLIDKKEEVEDKIVINNEVIYPWLTDIAENPNPPETKDHSKIGCTAGNSSLYIMPDGKIAPCPFLREFEAGDIRKDNLREIWDNSTTFNIFRNVTCGDLKGKCNGCEFLGTRCYGGCRAAAFANTGDLYAEDPLCWKHLSSKRT